MKQRLDSKSKSPLHQLCGRGLGEGVFRLEAISQIQSLLPLTLTLSPRERERAALIGMSYGC